jgi:hypothetical protein
LSGQVPDGYNCAARRGWRVTIASRWSAPNGGSVRGEQEFVAFSAIQIQSDKRLISLHNYASRLCIEGFRICREELSVAPLLRLLP